MAIDVRSPVVAGAVNGSGAGAVNGKADYGERHDREGGPVGHSSTLASQRNQQKAEGLESNATKVSKMIDEFMAKVTGMHGQGKRVETALSAGSFRDESVLEDVARVPSMLSNRVGAGDNFNKSKKSVVSQH